jgi:glycerophosphoryl diester phosphodiesterase
MTQVRGLDASRGLSQWTGPRAAVPTLEEVLDRFRATPAVIEIKEPDAVEPTVRLIHRLGLQGHIVLGSDDLEVMARLNRSGLRTIASRTDAMLLVPLALVGIAPRALRYDVLSITPRYFGWPIPVLRMTVAARGRGIPTHVWTVNDPSGALAYWRGGVSGIVTDDPGAMLRARPR